MPVLPRAAASAGEVPAGGLDAFDRLPDLTAIGGPVLRDGWLASARCRSRLLQHGSRPRRGCCPHPPAVQPRGVCSGGLGVLEALPAQPAYLADQSSRRSYSGTPRASVGMVRRTPLSRSESPDARLLEGHPLRL